MKKVLYAVLLISGWMVAAGIFLAQKPERIVLDLPAGSSRERSIGGIFRQWADDPALAGALVGFCVLDENGGIVFTSGLAETALCPASALKTVTTGAAFDLLGPDFRFETKLAASAPVDAAGIVAGDLILSGSGDPTLTSGDLAALAREAVNAGLKQVEGELRVDASAFPGPPASDHWNWGDIGNAYGAGAYGVNVDRNRLVIRFRPAAAEGERAELLGGDPVAADTRWINRVTTGPPGSGDRVVVYSEPYGRTITLQGTVPAGERVFTVTGAIPDPPALAAQLLRSRLQEAGVRFPERAPANPAASPAANTPLAVHRSAALPEIIDHLHRVSDNLEAQCLFLSMGRLQNGDPAEVVRSYWEEHGVSFTGLRLIDGSGLARANMIRPVDLARVNYTARRGPHGARFRESLGGDMDGRIRSKRGAMSGVRTEVGFLMLDDGRELTFALIANGLGPAVDFWQLRNELLRDLRK